jgi:type II secretory pathway component GspD/PulD (secretin)
MKLQKAVLILSLLIAGTLFGKNSLIEIRVMSTYNDYIIELFFENEKINYEQYNLFGPPRMVIDFSDTENKQGDINRYIDYSPLYLIRIAEWKDRKTSTKAVFEFHQLPEIDISQEANKLIIKWVKEEAKPEIITAEQKEQSNLDNRVSMNFHKADLVSVLKLLALQNDLNIIAGEDVQGTVSVNLKDVTVGEMLDAVLKVNNYSWFLQNDIIVVKEFEKDITGELMTRVFRLNYVDANNVSAAISNVLSSKGKVNVYSPGVRTGAGGSTGGSGQSSSGMGGMQGMSGLSGMQGMSGLGGMSSGGMQGGSSAGGMNTAALNPTYEYLLITDFAHNFKNIEAIINELDKPIPQININVKYIETKLDVNEKMGINWTTRASMVGGPIANENAITFGKWKDLNLAVLNIAELSTIIEILTTTTESELKQAPNATTLDNNMANIQVGTTYPIAVTQPATQFGPSIVTYEEQSVNISLNVTPHVTKEDIISMAVNTQVQAVTGFSGPDLDRPIVSTRSANTIVRVPDGQTLIIGGLILEQDIITEKRVPILGRIPLIGFLFRHQTKTPQRSELLIFITPSIVNSD